jgi:hypothetical protein
MRWHNKPVERTAALVYASKWTVKHIVPIGCGRLNYEARFAICVV